jgi:hypothetical protein
MASKVSGKRGKEISCLRNSLGPYKKHDSFCFGEAVYGEAVKYNY